MNPELVVAARILQKPDEALILIDQIQRLRPVAAGPRLMFSALRSVTATGLVPKISTIESILKDLPKDRVPDAMRKDAITFLMRAASLSLPDQDESSYAVQQLLNKERKRILLIGQQALARSLEQDNLDSAEETMASVAADLADLEPETKGRVIDMEDYNFLDVPEELKGDRIATGLPTLDKHLRGGGLRRDYWIIAGYSGDGKTVLSVFIAYNAWLQGKNVVYATAEQPDYEIASALLSLHSRKFLEGGIPFAAIEEGGSGLPPKEKDALKRTQDDWHEQQDRKYGRFTLVDCGDEATIITVRNQLTQVRRKTRPLDVTVIDYLQYLEPLNARDTNDIQIARTIKAGRNIARRFHHGEGTFLISPHPTKQEAKTKANEEQYYTKTDLRGSAEVIHKSTTTIWTLIPDDLRELGYMKLGILKHRRGPAGPPRGWQVVPQLDRCFIGEAKKQLTEQEVKAFLDEVGGRGAYAQ